jgi:hypothetical protein
MTWVCTIAASHLLLLLLLLPAGEHIGDGTPPMVDIAVDPLDGTTLTAQGRSGAIAVRPGMHCKFTVCMHE